MSKSTFTLDDLRELEICTDAFERIASFGDGTIENTAAGWQVYIDAQPEEWTMPVRLAWALHRTGSISCPNLVWDAAKLAFREQPEEYAELRKYAQTLGPSNWREAYASADAAGDPDADGAWAAAWASDAAADATYTTSLEHATRAAVWVAEAVDETAAAYATPERRSHIRSEIVSLAVEALKNTGSATTPTYKDSDDFWNR